MDKKPSIEDDECGILRRIGSGENLPSELVDQLYRHHRYSQFEMRIVNIFRDALDSRGDADQVMVMFYDRYNIVLNKRSLLQTMIRMQRRGDLIRVRRTPAMFELAQRWEDD